MRYLKAEIICLYQNLKLVFRLQNNLFKINTHPTSNVYFVTKLSLTISDIYVLYDARNFFTLTRIFNLDSYSIN